MRKRADGSANAVVRHALCRHKRDTLNLELDPGGGGFSTDLAFEVDFQRPTGWSFEFFGGIDFDIELPIDGGYDLTGRAYRSFGNFEVGAYTGFAGNIPNGAIDVHWLGADVEYEAGRLRVLNDTQLFFISGGGGLAGVLNTTELEYDVNERLDIGVGAFLTFAGGPLFAVLQARAELDLGMVEPYAYAVWSPTAGGFGVGVGADFERPIRSGPFSLIGDAEFLMGTGGAVAFDASVGIRFARGDVDDDS